MTRGRRNLTLNPLFAPGIPGFSMYGHVPVRPSSAGIPGSFRAAPSAEAFPTRVRTYNWPARMCQMRRNQAVSMQVLDGALSAVAISGAGMGDPLGPLQCSPCSLPCHGMRQ